MTWNADPIIFSVGSFSLRWYSLMFVVGFMLGDLYVKKVFVKYKKDPEIVSNLTSYLIIGTIVGSRLVHCVFYDPQYYLQHPLEVLMVWQGGLASHGGYMGVIIAAALFLRKHRDIDFFWLMDVLAGPCLFVGGLIRLGNLMNSEIYGKVTDVPWAFVFENVDLFPRHPSQLYESAGYFTIAFILHSLLRYKFDQMIKGSILCVAIVLSFVFRYLIEFTKDEQSTLTDSANFNMGQILSLAFALFGVAFFFYIRKRAQVKHVSIK